MRLVVDMNILFSFFKKWTFTRRLITQHDLVLYAPSYALKEIKKYENEIKKKGKIDASVFDLYKQIVSWFVTFVPSTEYESCKEEAIAISPDPDDVVYFALALKLQCPIWSNDKALKKQSSVKIFSTPEVKNELSVR
jgi:predicted nucleic acid-binding protein